MQVELSEKCIKQWAVWCALCVQTGACDGVGCRVQVQWLWALHVK